MQALERWLLVVVAAGITSCAGVQLASTPDMHPGQRLFNGHVRNDIDCYRCHDGSGRGTLRGPSLEGTRQLSDGEIREYIDEGESIMPAFKDKLSDEEKRMIVDWLRLEFGPHTP